MTITPRDGDVEWSHYRWSRKEIYNYAVQRLKLEIGGLGHTLLDHRTAFCVKGMGKKPGYHIILYESYRIDHEEIERELRKVFDDDNVDRFIRVRKVKGGTQIFFFGPEVDIDTVMECPLFIQYSYFNYGGVYRALHNWLPSRECRAHGLPDKVSESQTLRGVTIDFM